MTPLTISLSGVTKRFGAHTAVEAFDLEVPRGSVYGLLGPNGSGKTTTLRMIMGILRPDRGRVRLFGQDPAGRERFRVGYLPEERGLYRKMRVMDLLAFLGEIRGLGAREARRRGAAWLERLELAGWSGHQVQDLSKGMQQKVQLVATILHEPELLILDEPFSGLDPINQEVFDDIVRELRARGTTIVLSTHLMDQAERLCQRVCLIARARKVLDGELAQLKAAEGRRRLAVAWDGPEPWPHWPGLDAPRTEGDEAVVDLPAGTDPQALLRAAVEAGVRVRRFELLEPSLHEIFLRHAGGRG